MLLERLGIWPARVAWFLLPALIGPAAATGLDNRSDAVQLVAEILMWAAWFVGMVCLFAPNTVSLTLFRIVAPGSGLAAALLTLAGTPSPGRAALAAFGAALATGLAFLAPTGDVMVNGSAYGPERRLALRTPASLLIGPIPVAWALLVATVVLGPLTLASQRWVVGGILTILAVPFAYVVGRSLHQLSRRWIVFTPAGFVIHDYFVLAESILLKRSDIAELGPAPADPKGTLDISAGAKGLALQVEAKEPLSVVVRDGRNAAVTETVRLIFTPTLPGRLLREARIRGINVT